MTTAHGQTKMNNSLYTLTQRLYGSHHTNKALWDNMQSIVDVNKQACDCTNPFYNWPDITRKRDYVNKAAPLVTLFQVSNHYQAEVVLTAAFDQLF